MTGSVTVEEIAAYSRVGRVATLILQAVEYGGHDQTVAVDGICFADFF